MCDDEEGAGRALDGSRACPGASSTDAATVAIAPSNVDRHTPRSLRSGDAEDLSNFVVLSINSTLLCSHTGNTVCWHTRLCRTHAVLHPLITPRQFSGGMAEGKRETLWHAAATGNWRTVTSILSQGLLDINARDSNGYTPLHCAIAGNQPKVVMLLLDNGASVNAIHPEKVAPRIPPSSSSSDSVFALPVSMMAFLELTLKGMIHWNPSLTIVANLRASRRCTWRATRGALPSSRPCWSGRKSSTR